MSNTIPSSGLPAFATAKQLATVVGVSLSQMRYALASHGVEHAERRGRTEFYDRIGQYEALVAVAETCSKRRWVNAPALRRIKFLVNAVRTEYERELDSLRPADLVAGALDVVEGNLRVADCVNRSPDAKPDKFSRLTERARSAVLSEIIKRVVQGKDPAIVQAVEEIVRTEMTMLRTHLANMTCDVMDPDLALLLADVELAAEQEEQKQSESK